MAESTSQDAAPSRACSKCGKEVPATAPWCPYCRRPRRDLRQLAAAKHVLLGVQCLLFALFVWGLAAGRWAAPGPAVRPGPGGLRFSGTVFGRSGDFWALVIASALVLAVGAVLETVASHKVKAGWRRLAGTCTIKRRCTWCGTEMLAEAVVCPQCRRMRADILKPRHAGYALLAAAVIIGVGGFLAGYAAELWHVVPDTPIDRLREVVGAAHKEFGFLAFLTSPTGIALAAVTLALVVAAAVCDLVADARMTGWRV